MGSDDDDDDDDDDDGDNGDDDVELVRPHLDMAKTKMGMILRNEILSVKRSIKRSIPLSRKYISSAEGYTSYLRLDRSGDLTKPPKWTLDDDDLKWLQCKTTPTLLNQYIFIYQ